MRSGKSVHSIFSGLVVLCLYLKKIVYGIEVLAFLTLKSQYMNVVFLRDKNFHISVSIHIGNGWNADSRVFPM